MRKTIEVLLWSYVAGTPSKLGRVVNSSWGRCPREVDMSASLAGGVGVFEIKEKILNRRNGLNRGTEKRTMCSRNWECGLHGVKGHNGGWQIGWTRTVKSHEGARSWIHSEGNEGEQARVLIRGMACSDTILEGPLWLKWRQEQERDCGWRLESTVVTTA